MGDLGAFRRARSQGTYETFVEIGRQHYGGDLSGRWLLTAGLGGMGGAQPLAAVMAGASCLAIERQPSRIELRLRTGYLDRATGSLDEALAIVRDATAPDAVSDWTLLNALLNTASGATWMSLHRGGGVGMGYSQHAGMVIVADGTPEAARRLERVLWNDPATGVMRHADAG